MKTPLLSAVAFVCFFYACQSSESQKEKAGGAVTETETTPALRADVIRIVYTSEKTNLLAAPDFGSSTIQIIDPLQPVEVLDTTDFFFYRVRVPAQDAEATGYIDKVYLSTDLEAATQLHERRGRK